MRGNSIVTITLGFIDLYVELRFKYSYINLSLKHNSFKFWLNDLKIVKHSPLIHLFLTQTVIVHDCYRIKRCTTGHFPYIFYGFVDVFTRTQNPSNFNNENKLFGTTLNTMQGIIRQFPRL